MWEYDARGSAMIKASETLTLRNFVAGLCLVVGVCAVLALLPYFYHLGNRISEFPWNIIKSSYPGYTGTFWAEPELGIRRTLHWYWSIGVPLSAWFVVLGIFVSFIAVDNK